MFSISKKFFSPNYNNKSVERKSRKVIKFCRFSCTWWIQRPLPYNSPHNFNKKQRIAFISKVYVFTIEICNLWYVIYIHTKDMEFFSNSFQWFNFTPLNNFISKEFSHSMKKLGYYQRGSGYVDGKEAHKCRKSSLE